ncbi:MAG: hypothetical protein ACLSHG_06785 [Oscillospiraceae bacterium]
MPLRTSRAMSSRSCVVYSFARSAQRAGWSISTAASGGEIVQRRGKRVVHEAHIPVGRREYAVGAELFPVGAQGLGELFCAVSLSFFAAARPASFCSFSPSAALPPGYSGGRVSAAGRMRQLSSG